MTSNARRWALVSGLTMLASAETAATAAGFEDDLALLKQHGDVLTLRDGDRQVVVSPRFQGRVMLSTWGGPAAPSIGWVNRAAVSAPESETAPFNNYGGEERFWLGPEAGQFALFFKGGAKQAPDNWFTPKGFGVGPFDVQKSSSDAVALHRAVEVDNAAGTHFKLAVSRFIRILPRGDVEKITGPLGDAKWVAFESTHRIRNDGDRAWTPETGAVCIWTLGMFVGTPDTWAIAPYKSEGTGQAVKDDYYGKVPPDRLVQVKDKPIVLFKADGKLRSKIGVSPRRARDVLGSIDLAGNVLTIVSYDQPAGEPRYVNNYWEAPQSDPFGGDGVQSYNDGGDGFYELETASPAAFLKPGEIQAHTSRTIHVYGRADQLDPIATKVFGVSVSDIKQALPRQ